MRVHYLFLKITKEHAWSILKVDCTQKHTSGMLYILIMKIYASILKYIIEVISMLVI